MKYHSFVMDTEDLTRTGLENLPKRVGPRLYQATMTFFSIGPILLLTPNLG